jgi:hypothetical protein
MEWNGMEWKGRGGEGRMGRMERNVDHNVHGV